MVPLTLFPVEREVTVIPVILLDLLLVASEEDIISFVIDEVVLCSVGLMLVIRLMFN